MRAVIFGCVMKIMLTSTLIHMMLVVFVSCKLEVVVGMIMMTRVMSLVMVGAITMLLRAASLVPN